MDVRHLLRLLVLRLLRLVLDLLQNGHEVLAIIRHEEMVQVLELALVLGPVHVYSAAMLM